MILGEKIVRESLKDGNISIDPIDEIQVQPASVDLTLANDLLLPVPDESCYDFKKEVEYKESNIQNFLNPGQFALGSTREYIKISKNISAFICGRSSVGRAGLIVETSGFVDPGFNGNITLELFNCTKTPMQLHEGMRICQIIFFHTRGVDKEYGQKNNKYQGQLGATGTKIHEDVQIGRGDNVDLQNSGIL